MNPRHELLLVEMVFSAVLLREEPGSSNPLEGASVSAYSLG